MDHVVGTGPDEHLMSDVEHMKTSLYLTDVVLLRHEGDTVNFLGLEITKTSKGFEVKNSPSESLRVGKLETDSQSWQTLNSDGARVSNSWDGHDNSNFCAAVGKLIFMAPWRPGIQFAIQQLSTEVLNPTTESKRTVKQLIRYLKDTQQTCLRLEPREMVRKGLLELVGRSGSDWAGGSATRQSVTGYHCDVQNVTMCNRSLKQDSDQFQFMRSRVLRSQCLRWRIVWTRRTFQGTSLRRFSSSRDGFRLDTTHSTAQRTRRTQAHRNTMLGCATVDTRETSVCKSSGHEEQHSRSLHETSGWTENAVARKETWTSNPGRYEW